jgi:hypothetical protein
VLGAIGLGLTLGLLLILIGGFVMVAGYGEILSCLSRYPNPEPACWTRTGGLYFGGVTATIGTMILVGPNIARLLRGLGGTGSDSG